MDCGRDKRNVVEIIHREGPRKANDNFGDRVVGERDVGYEVMGNEGSVDAISNRNHDGRRSQILPESLPSNATNQPKAIGSMSYKTKLCDRYRAGICPHITDCDFAHSIEELRRSLPNWQGIMPAPNGGRASMARPREEFRIPSVDSSSFMNDERSFKIRRCKRFYTEEGCPFGDDCPYIHDEQTKERESVVINLAPRSGDRGATGNARGGGGGAPGTYDSITRPSNWKTRLCMRWEYSRSCSFGSNCRFAHGPSEIRRFGVGFGETETKAADVASKAAAGASKAVTDIGAAAARADGPPDPQRPPGVLPRTEARSLILSKSVHKIKGIYGDWIDEL